VFLRELMGGFPELASQEFTSFKSKRTPRMPGIFFLEVVGP
jgi:hypothetical protein|tara:strand:- start:17002 stop:17124 length:123 start_codon:yes stop_codon:yes gene_type:complete